MSQPIRLSEAPQLHELKRSRPKKQIKKNRHIFRSLIIYASSLLLLTVSICLLWFFFSLTGSQLRYEMADSLITTQHRSWAKYLIGSDQLQKRVAEYQKQFDNYAEQPVTKTATLPTLAEQQADANSLVEIKPVSGRGFKGYLMTISDPKKVRIVVTQNPAKGEKVTSMVKRTGAVAGVNGGGFIDPNWEGNGFQPEGIVMSGGKILYLDVNNDVPINVMGITKDGLMIAGKYSANQLLKMNVREAVSFAPRFIVNGVGMIKSEANGWGIAPRTVMAQKADGSIMFAIIDGRQPGYSIGATLYDVQEILLENGAIIAANLDGGASTVLVKDNQIINKPSSKYGERYIPTAWLVFENPDSVQVKNIWAGLKINDIDPSKW